jgi:hypothetical protein
VPTASGFSTVAAIDPVAASERLAMVLSAPSAFTVVHCCGGPRAFPVLQAAGAAAVSFDLGLVPVRETDRVAELAEAGLGLLVGALPTASVPQLVSGPPLIPRQTAEAVVAMWRRTGLPAADLAGQVVITPACGLASASPEAARAALQHCREAARIAAEMIEARA